ncbi:MAG: primosomal protein N' family DNA-binding protein, partial [Acidimicrobiales bacterium]
MVRVLPDVAAIDKEFDYLVPDHLDARVGVGTVGVGTVGVGTMVRVDLSGRRVGGWVVAADVAATPGVTLRPLARVRGHGPEPVLVDLAAWAAWRWAGRRASLLATA